MIYSDNLEWTVPGASQTLWLLEHIGNQADIACSHTQVQPHSYGACH